MIKTLSPYYLQVPLTNPLTGQVCNSFTMNIYVWGGSKTAIPSVPAYVVTKINAAGSSGNHSFDISKLASDYIEFACQGQSTTIAANGNNQVWVMYEVFYDDAPTVPGIQDVQLAIKGYGYFLEGNNPQPPTNKILITGDDFKVNRNGMFVFPVLTQEPAVATRTLTLYGFTIQGETPVYQPTLEANFTYNQAYIFVRPVGETEWTPATVEGENYIVPEDIAADVFEVKATAFDVVTGQIITSNVFTLIPLKIWKIEPNSGGYGISVYFYKNIIGTSDTLQIYGLSGPDWDDVPWGSGSPIPYSFTPTGDFIVRIMANGNYSNEVPLTIPLSGTINIP